MQREVLDFESFLEEHFKDYLQKAIKIILEDVFSDMQPMITMYASVGDICDQLISSVGELDPDKYQKDIDLRDQMISVFEEIEQSTLIEFDVDTFFYIDDESEEEEDYVKPEIEDDDDYGDEDEDEIVGL